MISAGNLDHQTKNSWHKRVILRCCMNLLVCYKFSSRAKSVRWALSGLSLIIPFLIIWLYSNHYYASESARNPSNVFGILILPIAMFSSGISIVIAPIKSSRYKVVFGVIVFVVTMLLLFLWTIITAGIHGDSL